MQRWSLPNDCPFPFLADPPYSIHSNQSRDLRQSYLDALYLNAHPTQISLDNFARFLIVLLSEQDSISLEIALRELILPIHDFDNKWRSTVLATVQESNETSIKIVEIGSKKVKQLHEKEKLSLLEAHGKWKAKMEAKVASNVAAEKVGESSKVKEWTVPDETVHDWITTLELMETQLQSLLLLALLQLSNNSDPITQPIKQKRKKDPERYSSTLDPELLLDFLTDRLQIWRLMEDVKGLGSAATMDAQGKEIMRVEKDRDQVQEWWEDIIEMLFSNRLPTSVLAHHRAKLFPSTTSTESLSTRILPAPSPFKVKDRTLLSLDKSARRKVWQNQSGVIESPTMKRLIGENGNGDIFKVPAMKRRSIVPLALPVIAETIVETLPQVTTKLPRKQARPLPSKSNTIAISSKALFNRREVVSRKASQVGAKKKAIEEKPSAQISRKRKSISPKKATSSTAFLVNNRTPTKLSRSASLPSFASLGAAFRPGQPPPLGLPSFIPKPPILPMDEDSEDEMDWFTGDEAVTSTIATPVKESTLEGADWFVADTPLKA